MNVVIITGQITFMPNNYRNHLLEIIDHPAVKAIAIHQNYTPSMLLKSLLIITAGAYQTGIQLLKNITAYRKTENDPLIKKAKNKKMQIYKASNFNSEEFKQWLIDHKIDLLINMRTRHIFRPIILNIKGLTCLNVHHGLLPRQRGTMCDLWSLLENKEKGFSIHVMSQKLDDGEIISTHTVPTQTNNYQQYLKSTYTFEKKAIIELLDHVIEKKQIPPGQSNPANDAIYYRTPGVKEILNLKRRGITL